MSTGIATRGKLGSMMTETVERPTFTQWLKWRMTRPRPSAAVEDVAQFMGSEGLPWPSRARTYTTFAAFFRERGVELRSITEAFEEYERFLQTGKSLPAFKHRAHGPHRDRRSFTILPETFKRVQELCDAYDPPISQGAVVDKAIAALYGRKLGKL